jgi:thioredoxin-dependent peroxiredoxin
MIKTSLSPCSRRQLLHAGLFASALVLTSLLHAAETPSTPPKVGEVAPNFTLQTLEDRSVELKSLVQEQPVVLVVLRGWPGYQCPLCTRQVQEFVAKATEFKQRGAKVVMIYPGPAEQLQEHAREFLKDKQWPADFVFLVDPDYLFTNAYGLRWDAKKETAYPSTFVLERGGKVRFAHVSKSHGNRLTAANAIVELP